ncbi:hypothetical protein CBS101457_006025 [Exobasidium rhododendri]|nr:hypothetical protein CBS101457_006025 [Exobasidium rhododendri]
MSFSPSATLYVKNIPSKIKKEELRRQLYCLFSTYGKILDVVATRAQGMRCQAFVVFQDLASSTAALRGLEGFSFYDNSLSIDYAKSTSRATIIAEKGTLPETLSQRKTVFSSAGEELKRNERKRAREEAGREVPVAADSEEEEEDDDIEIDEDEDDREEKKPRIDETAS